LFYSAFTAFLGFEVNEGRVQGHGDGRLRTTQVLREVRKLITLRDEWWLEIEQACFEFLAPETLPYNRGIPASIW